VQATAAPIRVVLAEMPAMLRDIVKNILDRQPGINVIELAADSSLRDVLERTEADVLIVGASEPADSAVPRQVLSALPLTRVLMLAIDGQSAVMYELRPHQTPLGEVSREALVRAIRVRAAHAAWWSRD